MRGGAVTELERQAMHALAVLAATVPNFLKRIAEALERMNPPRESDHV